MGMSVCHCNQVYVVTVKYRRMMENFKWPNASKTIRTTE